MRGRQALLLHTRARLCNRPLIRVRLNERILSQLQRLTRLVLLQRGRHPRSASCQLHQLRPAALYTEAAAERFRGYTVAGVDLQRQPQQVLRVMRRPAKYRVLADGVCVAD